MTTTYSCQTGPAACGVNKPAADWQCPLQTRVFKHCPDATNRGPLPHATCRAIHELVNKVILLYSDKLTLAFTCFSFSNAFKYHYDSV